MKYQALFTFFCVVVSVVAEGPQNLSCYQCVRNAEAECEESELRPCTTVADRCVIHMIKDRDTGFVLKRQCGLAPCGFDDDMASKGLGWGKCDRSKDSYFCVFCCKGDGCNKNSAGLATSKFLLIFVALLVIILLEIIKGFQPPYAPESNKVG